MWHKAAKYKKTNKATSSLPRHQSSLILCERVNIYPGVSVGNGYNNILDVWSVSVFFNQEIIDDVLNGLSSSGTATIVRDGVDEIPNRLGIVVPGEIELFFDNGVVSEIGKELVGYFGKHTENSTINFRSAHRISNDATILTTLLRIPSCTGQVLKR